MTLACCNMIFFTKDIDECVHEDLNSCQGGLDPLGLDADLYPGESRELQLAAGAGLSRQVELVVRGAGKAKLLLCNEGPAECYEVVVGELEASLGRAGEQLASRQTWSPPGPAMDWSDWSFCTPSNLCSVGEGDCDEDADCVAGLSCGTDNCYLYGAPDTESDCCETGLGLELELGLLRADHYHGLAVAVETTGALTLRSLHSTTPFLTAQDPRTPLSITIASIQSAGDFPLYVRNFRSAN